MGSCYSVWIQRFVNSVWDGSASNDSTDIENLGAYDARDTHVSSFIGCFGIRSKRACPVVGSAKWLKQVCSHTICSVGLVFTYGMYRRGGKIEHHMIVMFKEKVCLHLLELLVEYPL